MGTHVVRASYHRKLFVIIIILKINPIFFISFLRTTSCPARSALCRDAALRYGIRQKYVTGSTSNIEKSTLNKRLIFNRRRG